MPTVSSSGRRTALWRLRRARRSSCVTAMSTPLSSCSRRERDVRPRARVSASTWRTGPSAEDTRELFEATVAYWRRWLAQSRYTGRWREMVNRSALTLKLLTYAPSGAIVAAPDHEPARAARRRAQLGLPLHLDPRRRLLALRASAARLHRRGRRPSWDGSPSASGRTAEGPPDRCRSCTGSTGARSCPKSSSTTSRATSGSAPVRVGNGAADQLQLDIYGELIDSVYLHNKHGTPIYHDAWEDLRRIVDWLCEHWDQADEGIWETRGGRQQFTYSRLMSLGRGRARRADRPPARLAGRPRPLVARSRRDLPPDHGARAGTPTAAPSCSTTTRPFWMRQCCSCRSSSSYPPPIRAGSPHSTRSAASSSPTAWCTATTPRHRPTGSAATRAPSRSARSGTSRRSRARGDSTTHGWRSRRCSPTPTTSASTPRRSGRTGEQLGNFPQAFTHLSLISAAVNLDRALG